jgi:acyl-coenzyme A thioesterase PaaI-like protein
MGPSRKETAKAGKAVAAAMPSTAAAQADQDRFAPHSICFGCGPANKKGLQIKSHWEGDPAKVGEGGGRFVMAYTPQEHHQAFPGVINGGILGTLLDCHSNWCAATALMHKWGWDAPQCTVTADFHVRLKRPTPYGKPLRLEAKVESITEDRATIHCDVLCDGKVTATCDGTFVAVKEGHPAWHRWG